MSCLFDIMMNLPIVYRDELDLPRRLVFLSLSSPISLCSLSSLGGKLAGRPVLQEPNPLYRSLDPPFIQARGYHGAIQTTPNTRPSMCRAQLVVWHMPTCVVCGERRGKGRMSASLHGLDDPSSPISHCPQTTRWLGRRCALGVARRL